MNPPSSSPRLAKISELARLARVPAPTIKHYMREGLLPPPERRTSRNMAWYDVALAERIRVIKDLQQQHFLPLRIIADILEPAPSARIRGDLHQTVLHQLGSLEPAVRDGHGDARADRLATAPTGPRSRSEVLATLQVDEEELDLLCARGLLEPQGGASGEPMYADADLDMLETIHDARDAGLGDLFSLESLHGYLEAVRSVARVELDVFRDRILTDSTLSESSRAAIVRKAVSLGARLLIATHNKLIISELRGLAERTSTIPPPPPSTPRDRRTRRQQH